MQGKVARLKDVTLWYCVQGDGVPVVLLHGGPGAYDYMEPIAEMLSPCCRTIRYEQRGSHRSEKKGPYNVETFVDDLEQLRIHLGLEHWMVCGHSWGASLALAYAAKYRSRISALIHISGTGINPAWHDEYRVNRLAKMNREEREEYDYLRTIISTLGGEEELRARNGMRELSLRTDLFDTSKFERLPRTDGHFVNNEVNQKVGQDWNEYMRRKEFTEQLSLVPVPVLFIHGEEDPRPLEYVDELAGCFSNSEIRVIPKSGHYPWIDAPDALRACMLEFLEKACSQ